MDTSELKNELPHKERKVKDLANFIKSKIDEDLSNYSILLGAGASVTSGIKTGYQLCEEWRREIYTDLVRDKEYIAQEAKEYFIKNHGSWYNPQNEYSSLFEKKFDLPSQRRRFVESEVDRKLPSIGYAYLVSLANRNYINTIFTTNFDDLVNEAFYQFSNERPFLCAHDSSVKDMSVKSSRPKIIKLHGDYLFDDIKSTLRETESLEENTKDKLAEFSKELGLILIGYSGSDRSIMDVINHMLRREEYLRNGVYWCVRKGDKINNDLRKMLWKDRVYYIEIDGFDELLAELHHELMGNLELKDQSNSKREKIIDMFAKDLHQLSNSSSYIMKDLESLRRHQSSMDISNLIRDLAEKDGTFSKEKISEGDLKNLLSIDNLIKQGKYEQSINAINNCMASCKDSNIENIYRKKLVSVYSRQGDYSKAIKIIDSVISDDCYDYDLFSAKAFLFNNIKERLEFIQEGKVNFTHEFKYHNLLASTCLSLLSSRYQTENIDSIFNMVEESLDASLKLEPGLNNAAWFIKLDQIISKRNSNSSLKNVKDEIELSLNALLDKASSINSNSIQYVKLLCLTAKTQNNYDGCLRALDVVSNVYGKSKNIKKEALAHHYVNLLCCLMDFNDKTAYKEKFSLFLQGESSLGAVNKNSIDYKYASLRYSVSVERDIEKAKSIYREIISQDTNGDYTEELISFASCFKDFVETEQLEIYLDKSESSLSDAAIAKIKIDIFLIKENYAEALTQVEKYLEEGGSYLSYLAKKSYILLVSEQYDAAYTLLHENKKFYINKPDGHTLIINRECAAKKMGRKIDELALRNVSSAGNKEHAICALSLLGNDAPAQMKINEMIEHDYFNLFVFCTWPAIDKNLLDTVISKGKFMNSTYSITARKC